MKRKHAATIKSLSLAAVLIILMALFAGCGAGGSAASSGDPVFEDGYYLDTVCSIAVYSIQGESGEAVPAKEAEEESQEAIAAAFDLCKDLESKLSRTRKDSDISRLNEAGGEWVAVSDETADLINKGLEYSALSDGDFDITVGGITKLWDFHAEAEDAKLPDADTLAEAASHVGYNNVETDGNRVRITDPDCEIDLGGIAKGYIGDKMTESLEASGVTSGIINLGGNVICIGGKTEDEGFAIGIETPFSDRSEIVGKVEARDKTLVTSGVYERMIEVDGKQYHHILDTDTGWPVDSDLDAVTLIAEKGSSADIDAAATICLIKGVDGARSYLEEYMDGVEAVFVLKDGSIVATEGSGFEES